MFVSPVFSASRDRFDRTDLRRGSVLLPTLVLIVAIGSMCMVIQMTHLAMHRSAVNSHRFHRAALAANSALGLQQLRLETDPDHFVLRPAPHAPCAMGGETVELLSATRVEETEAWRVGIRAEADGVSFALGAVLQPVIFRLPHGLVLTGIGDPAEDLLVMNGASVFGSYDPAVGIASPGDSGSVWANGSVEITGTALVQGDVNASGWVSTFGPSNVTGSIEEEGEETEVDPFEELAPAFIAEAIANNDNALLEDAFGSDWSPVPGPMNHGDLLLSGGTHRLGAGVYHLRDVSVTSVAVLTLDTSTGPITLVVSGATGLSVDSGSTVRIDAGGTEHGVMTVLGAGSGLVVQGASSFGRELSDPWASGYSRILGVGESGAIASQGGSSVFARLAAPRRPLLVGGSSEWYGSAVVRSAALLGSEPKFLIDESIDGREMGTTGDYEVAARWREHRARTQAGP
jgi:hypothetical protein